MTVQELIQELLMLPPNHKVVRSEHSAYTEVTRAQVIVVAPMHGGGWFNHPFRDEDKLRAHGVVVVD